MGVFRGICEVGGCVLGATPKAKVCVGVHNCGP